MVSCLQLLAGFLVRVAEVRNDLYHHLDNITPLGFFSISDFITELFPSLIPAVILH